MIFGKKRSKLSDEELIQKYRDDHRKQWVGELFNRHAHLVFGVCLKYMKNESDAKDATLSLFEKLLEDLKSKDVEKFSHWIYVVTRNHCLMILRKRSSDERNFRALNGSEDPESETAEVELRETKLTRLEEAMESLKDEQKQCVQLFYLEKKCYKEIAEKTGFSEKQVKSFIQNGKRNLKIKLLEHDEFKA